MRLPLKGIRIAGLICCSSVHFKFKTIKIGSTPRKSLISCALLLHSLVLGSLSSIKTDFYYNERNCQLSIYLSLYKSINVEKKTLE